MAINVEISITSFFIGMATAYYALMSYHLFFGEKRGSSRLHRILGWIFVYWTLSNAKDMVLMMPGMYEEWVFDMVFVADGWSALTYLAFLNELTRPGWVVWGRMLSVAVPFLVYSVAYALFPVHTTTYPIAVFLILFGLYITVIGYRQSVAYMKYIRGYYSNIDEIDISWLRSVFLLAAASLLLWLFTSFSATAYADCVYYAVSVVLWQMVVYKCRGLKQVETAEVQRAKAEQKLETEHKAEGNGAARQFAFAGTLEEIVEGEKLYLYSNLTLDDLARRLKVNRTCLGAYFTTVVCKTFYDYINDLRVNEASIPLMNTHPEYTFEHIAKLSGFSSLSTFRRAFRKITGKMPSRFREEMLR